MTETNVFSWKAVTIIKNSLLLQLDFTLLIFKHS